MARRKDQKRQPRYRSKAGVDVYVNITPAIPELLSSCLRGFHLPKAETPLRL